MDGSQFCGPCEKADIPKVDKITQFPRLVVGEICADRIENDCSERFPREVQVVRNVTNGFNMEATSGGKKRFEQQNCRTADSHGDRIPCGGEERMEENIVFHCARSRFCMAAARFC